MGADILQVAFRTLILYFLALVVVRVMGKRSVANLAPFDLVVIIMIGSAAAIPMEESVSLLNGVIPVALLGVAQYLVSLLNVYSRGAERVTQGTPVLLVQNGKVLWENLKKERVTLEDLRIMLREAGIDNITDVQEARLEPNGKVSVIKTKEASPITPKDLQELAMIRMDAVLQETARNLRKEITDMFETWQKGKTG
ncbi:MAG TPA: DUF421 domain-containing protein [Clostridia bacterium]|nr:DUF421 domain-containing protein [Clostridia bacterium]